MADWQAVRERVEGLQAENSGLKVRLDLKSKALTECQKEVARLRAALEVVHGDLPVFEVERPALVVVR